MKLEPIITEKTTNLAKKGEYTFRIAKNMNKYKIKELVEKTFGVHVERVKTISLAGEVKKTIQGRKKVIKPGKKAIVKLKEKEKIDLFESKK